MPRFAPDTQDKRRSAVLEQCHDDVAVMKVKYMVPSLGADLHRSLTAVSPRSHCGLTAPSLGSNGALTQAWPQRYLRLTPSFPGGGGAGRAPAWLTTITLAGLDPQPPPKGSAREPGPHFVA